jgi:hypothetical protein
VVLTLHLPAFPCHSLVFGTARSSQERALARGGEKIFSVFEKIFA